MENARCLRAGVAKNDITTDAEGVLIHDPVYAKALVLSDNVTTIAIITMDVAGIGGDFDIEGESGLKEVSPEFLPDLRSRVQSELGIAGRNVLVNASHAHPEGKLLCSQDEQLKRVFDAVSRARESMVPVKVGSGVGYEDRIMVNRTLRLKNGQHWSVRESNPCPPDEDVEGIGPVDPEIGVIRVDRMDGTPLAVVYNFGCHPMLVPLDGGATAHFPGFASKVIEENLGAMAFFLQGACGNVIEIPFKDVNCPRDPEPIGTMLGLSTLKAAREIETHDADMGLLTETVQLPRRTDVPERIEALEREQAELLASLRGTSLNFKAFLPLYIRHRLDPDFPSGYSYRYLQAGEIGTNELAAMDERNRADIEKYLSNIQAMEKLARIEDRIATLKFHKALNDRAGEPTISAEIQGIRIGDCVLITSPAEMLTEVTLNIKKDSPCEHTFMASCSNGYIHYGAPASYYGKGGYEVTECLLAPEWQQVYESAANDIIHRLWQQRDHSIGTWDGGSLHAACR